MKRAIHTAFAILCLVVLSGTVRAETLSTTLTGDFRADSPDNIFVIVTVEWTAGSDEALWTVDIDSPTHPDAKLKSFFFNLDLGGDSVSFNMFSPDNPATQGTKPWGVVSSTNVTAAGGADFDFGVGGGTKNNEVNNATDLTFKLTLGSGEWNEDILTGASRSTGGGIPAPGSQMGAHVLSLDPTGFGDDGFTDSGFASGDWANGDPIPEPSTIVLALAAAGYCLLRRRR